MAKEKRKEKSLSHKSHKKNKKHKKRYESSSDSSSSDDTVQWVEAETISKKKKTKKKKKYASSSPSESDSDGGKMQWTETSSHSKSKKKKKHIEKKKYSSSSNSEEEPSSTECSKRDPLPDTTVEKRDSWMNEESFVKTFSKDEMFSSSRQRRADALKEQREKEEKIQKERELNPHWKKEGTGLPEKEATVDSLSLPSTSVGDGGYSWLKKAYYRIQEQAQNEGRSMEEVAVERWGSLSKLTSLIEEAEKRMKSHPDWKPSKTHYKDKHSYDNTFDKRRFKKPSNSHESADSFESLFQFRKPHGDSKDRKRLVNQFKSSKKTYQNFSSKDEEYKNSRSCRSPHKEHLSNSREELKVKLSVQDSSHRIPAWKKPKVLKDTEISNNTVPEIAKSSGKEIIMEEDSAPMMYSENDLNKLAAKQIKAEMMGNMALSEKLKKQLDEARMIVKEKGFAKQPSKIVEEVILSKYDSQGQVRPIQTTDEKIADYKQKKSSKYFDDGSSYSLKQMFEKEKLTTADDQLEMFVAASAQSNETAEIDYESGHISKKLSKNLSSTRQEERDIGKAIQQHKKLSGALENCRYCLDQPQMKKHLIVHIGESVYLSLPDFQTLTEGHCLIVPKNHVSSFLLLDENEWREVNDFKNQLRNMFRSSGKSVIFLETSMHFRHFPHAILECIPVPEEEGDMAPFYFKKAIQESEAEWAHNKKLIDLTNKGLRHSVPKGLPYFYVEFDPRVHAGYAHVIEDEKDFPRNFGKEVVGGMLDIDYNYLYKNKREDPLKKAKEVVEFQKKWKAFKNED